MSSHFPPYSPEQLRPGYPAAAEPIQGTAELDPLDLQSLQSSGLTNETIRQLGLESLSPEQIEERLGVKVRSGGYFIPYPGLRDQTGQPYGRVRLRVPNGKQRYCGGQGDDAQLYIPPMLITLPQSDLLIVTEGEKKAAKAVQEGIHCVALQGVWSWPDPAFRAVEKHERCSVSEETRPLPALLEYAKPYKKVLILGDSDLLANPQAAEGVRALSKSLRQLNIAAYTYFCPPVRDGSGLQVSKQGLDDWLLAESPTVVIKTLIQLYRAAEITYEELHQTVLAKDFAERNRLMLAHSPGRDWMAWSGSHWEADLSNSRFVLVKTFASSLRNECERISVIASRVRNVWPQGKFDDLPEPVREWLIPLQAVEKRLKQAVDELGKLQNIKAVLELAQPYVSVPETRWDSDPLLLGVQNGIVDLRTGTLKAPDSEAYIT